jgi:ParB-like chromosome segregation protein Spo0J
MKAKAKSLINVADISVGKLKPYTKNTRAHGDYDIEKIVASIARHGFTDPIETNSELIICAGHGRYYAAQKMGLKKVPVIINPELDDEEKFISYNIASNKTAENSSWDEPVLREQIIGLRTNFKFTDHDAIGMNVGEFDLYIEDGGEDDSNNIPGDSYQEQYGVIVICDDEQEQRAVYEKLKADGYDCRVVCT